MEIKKKIILSRPKILADQIFHHIKHMILSGVLNGGEKIPEVKIAHRFGVSRTPIREALRKLEKYGLVKIIPHRNSEVVTVDLKDKLYIGEVRIQLETLSAKLLSKKATDEDCILLYKISKECETLVENGDIANAFENDSKFHLELAKRCGNPYVYAIMKNLDAKVQLLRTVYCDTIDKIRKDFSLHFTIAEAICKHDSRKAVYAMQRHLKNSYDL